MKTMLFNPYTGKPRDPRDITSDPAGLLMLDPDEPLRPAEPGDMYPDDRLADIAQLNAVIQANCAPSKEAHDHKRVTPEGRAAGEQIVRLTEPAIAKLAAEGEADERCKSCAFRAGTVPNGCPQTIADVVKCIVEQKPFFCHVDKYVDGSEKICHGWFATRWAIGDKPPGQVPWDFSPPDERASS